MAKSRILFIAEKNINASEQIQDQKLRSKKGSYEKIEMATILAVVSIASNFLSVNSQTERKHKYA